MTTASEFFRRHASDGWTYCDQGHQHWGTEGAAGMLIRHTDDHGTTRYLLQKRSPWVQHGGTWSIPGGALHDDETPEEGAHREASEELGHLPELHHHHTHTDDHGGWAYHTAIYDAPHQFHPGAGDDGESDDHQWLTSEQIHDLHDSGDLHPGFAATWHQVRTARLALASWDEDGDDPEDLMGKPADWDGHYPHVGSTIHRGFPVNLTNHLHSIVHDSSRPAAERAHTLSNALSGNYLGMHWTDDHGAAHEWAGHDRFGTEDVGDDGSGRAPETTHVVLHAHKPDRQHIETDPDRLADEEVYPYGEFGEDEIPLKRGAPVHVSGISWSRPDGQWTRHDFERPVQHTALSRQAADEQPAPKVWKWKGLAYGPDGGYIDKEYEVHGPLYHGGGKRLRAGDQLKPGRKTNPWGDEGAKSKYIHFTTSKETAARYARDTGGHVFEVEPTGDFSMGYGGDEYKSEHPLNVVRKLDPSEWQNEAPQTPDSTTAFFRQAAEETEPQASQQTRPEWADGDFTAKTGHTYHTVTQPKCITMRTPEGRMAGWVNWGDDGVIGNMNVRHEHQRRGIATELLRRAREIRPDLQHSNRLSNDAQAWLKGIGEHTAALDSTTAFFQQAAEETGPHKVYRGVSVVLPPDKHKFVHDQSQPLPARAHMLLSEIKKQTADIDSEEMKGSTGGLGEFWSPSKDKAHEFGLQGGWKASHDHEREHECGDYNGDHGCPTTTAVIHAHEPAEKHQWKEIFRPGEKYDRELSWRLPVKPGTSVKVSGISWHEGEDHLNWDEQAERKKARNYGKPPMEEYDFSTPVKKRTSLTAHFRHAEAVDDDDDYRMQHRAPDRDGIPIHDLTQGIPEDVYTHPHYYSDMAEPSNQQAHAVLRKVRGKPDAKVRIYRSLPAEHAHQGFRTGDWVSTSKDYAREHGMHADDAMRDWPVISTTVRADDLHTDADDLREYGYNGEHRPAAMVAFKGGYHQEVRQHADGIVRKVQRRTPREGSLEPEDSIRPLAAAEVSNGVMVALVPPREVAEQLSQHGTEPAENLHVTLAYLGKKQDYTPEQLAWLPELVGAWAARHKPVQVRIGGVGKFSNPGEHVLWASVDIPGGSRLHSDLEQFLSGHGYRMPSEHGWTPHLTLAYVGEHFRFLPKVGNAQWCSGQVYVVIGGKWTALPFGGGISESVDAQVPG